jgi:hypothetical protein
MIAALRTAEPKLNARAGREGKGVGGKGIPAPPSLSPLLFSPPQFFVFRFAKCTAKIFV